MSLLLLMLPPGPPGVYAYVTSQDGLTVARHGSGVAATLLPPAGRGVEVVAIAPAARLAWQRVALPKGVGPGSARLRPALEGLLEDRLLEDAARLHFALEPSARGGGGECWVALCDRAWLKAHLSALEAAQRPVSRIVPEAAPQDGPVSLLITGTADQPQALITGEGVEAGVQALPFTPAALALLPQDDAGRLPEDAAVQAEPAVAQMAERLLGGGVALLSACCWRAAAPGTWPSSIWRRTPARARASGWLPCGAPGCMSACGGPPAGAWRWRCWPIWPA